MDGRIFTFRRFPMTTTYYSATTAGLDLPMLPRRRDSCGQRFRFSAGVLDFWILTTTGASIYLSQMGTCTRLRTVWIGERLGRNVRNFFGILMGQSLKKWRLRRGAGWRT